MDRPLVVSTDQQFTQTTEKLSLSSSDRKRLGRFYPKTLDRIDRKEQLSIQDIQNLTRSGFEDGAIIELMRATNSTYILTAQDVMELSQAGVSKKVIHHMKDSAILKS